MTMFSAALQMLYERNGPAAMAQYLGALAVECHEQSGEETLEPGELPESSPTTSQH